ncbi:MAG: hypothetical protein ABIH21_00235 [Patescibacteria group bacterium]
MKSSTYLFIFAIIIVVGLIGYAVTRPKPPSELDGFAQCITDKDVILYHAWWCPHCAEQKALFGDAFNKLNQIECSLPGSRAFTKECTDAGIESVPAWVFPGGRKFLGLQPLEKLAQETGCVLPLK